MKNNKNNLVDNYENYSNELHKSIINNNILIEIYCDKVIKTWNLYISNKYNDIYSILNYLN